MRIVVNHLTRMDPGFICVAGIDIAANRHVRPICKRSMLPLRWADVGGGVFGIGNIVELGRVQDRADPPKVEDREFHEQHLKHLERSTPEAFWSLLEAHRSTRLRRIFGPALTLDKTSCWTAEGNGRASLGVVVPDHVVRLYTTDHGRVRLAFHSGRAELDLSVTDLRFYDLDELNATWTVNRERLEYVAAMIGAGVPVMLSVGLTRAVKLRGASTRRHWLQVNNIHLKDDPLGDWAMRP